MTIQNGFIGQQGIFTGIFCCSFMNLMFKAGMRTKVNAEYSKTQTYAIFFPASADLYIEHLNKGPLNFAASHAAL